MKKFLFLILNLQTIVLAQQTPLSDALKNDNTEPNYLMMLFGLFFVIGLVYLTAFVYQKLLRIKVDDASIKNNSPKVVATTPLGQNKNLHIVKVNDEYILIGSTQNAITYIKDIDYFED